MNILTTILMSDSYKFSHFKQFPVGMTESEYYIESRGGSHDYQVMFGLQIFLKQYLCKPITREDVEEAAMIAALHGVPFNYAGWMHIVNAHGGYLPLEIRAVEEGTKVPTKNVLAVVRSTDPVCAWLPGHMETSLLRAVWYGTTVATISNQVRNVIKRYMDETSDAPAEGLPFKLHDFGARGVSSSESAGIGGAAHLVNFMGSDTLEGIMYARRYYGADMAGFSIPASEHSTITSWRRSFEIDAYKNMIESFGGDGKIYACVSDSYNLWTALELWKSLESDILRMGGTLVIRPDSGDPIATPVKTVQRLMELFGHKVNSKGFMVLPDHIRVIQGDGVNENSIGEILAKLKENGISADNIAFGMGGALLQHCDRDTYKFAMKMSAAVVDGKVRDVFKDPITQPGKKSKKGRLGLFRNLDTNEVVTLNVDENRKPLEDGNFKAMLRCVYRNGNLLHDVSFDKIRENAAA